MLQDGILRNRRLWIIGGAVLVVVATAIVTALIAKASLSTVSMGDRVVLSGGTRESVSVDLPLTTVEAVAAGWEDPLICLPQKGRYFEKKDTTGRLTPYILMYNDEDELLGMYMFGETEMPSPPWVHVQRLKGVYDLEYEHWSLEIMFKSPTLACGARRPGLRIGD